MEEMTDIRNRGVKDSPFWVGVIVIWLIMVIVGVTLALALGIWNLIGAF
jgi:hypothetical protein